MYAFVHVEKTGGTTMLSILRRSFGSRHCDIRLPLARRKKSAPDQRSIITAADLSRVKKIYRNIAGISGHSVKAYGDLELASPDIQYMTILRDPVARYRSHFLNRALDHSRETFEEWISSSWTHNWQTKMIAGEANANKAINLLASRFGFVGFTEKFDESLILLADWFPPGSFDPVYRPKNRLQEKRRPRDIARERYDMSYLDSPATLERIRAANALDEQVVEFARSEIYARQVARHQGNLAADVAELRRLSSESTRLHEPVWGFVLRNYIYKPLLHCRAV